MKAKTCLITILMATIIISSGCLDFKGEIKSGQVQVNEFKWLNFNTMGTGYQMIINSDYRGEAPVKIYLGDKVLTYTTLIKGENLIRGDYNEIVGYSNEVLNQRLTNKWQEQLVIKVVDYSKSESDYTTIYSKIIDMPYLNFEVKPSSSVIGKDGGYLTVTNNGNIEGMVQIIRDTYSPNWTPCGIYPPLLNAELKPQESKQITISLETSSGYVRADGTSGNCKLEQGEQGITPFKINFPLWNKTINFGGIDVRYRNQ